MVLVKALADDRIREREEQQKKKCNVNERR